MVMMNKPSPRPKSGARRPAQDRPRRLLDLSGRELYAVMSYRLAMAVIVLVAIIHLGH